MFPEFVEHGVGILRTGEVTYMISDGIETEETTEQDINDPLQAAYFTLMARGLRPGDNLAIESKLYMALGRAIARKVPNWRRLHPVREPLPVPEVFDYVRYFRNAA